MTHRLKRGDRVRVTALARVPGHQPGDKGIVLVGPIVRGSGEPYYIVAMDKGENGTTTTIFTIDEIEPDC